MKDELVMALEGPSLSEMASSEEVPAYDEEMDDVRSVLRDVCQVLAEDGRIKFIVQFVGESWPVDVGTDLVTVLEQLPNARKGPAEPFDIDFYEQGLERTLHFVPKDGEFEVLCESRHATWQAPEKAVRVPRETLRWTLTHLVNRFAELATAARPNIARHPWFTAWRLKASPA